MDIEFGADAGERGDIRELVRDVIACWARRARKADALEHARRVGLLRATDEKIGIHARPQPGLGILPVRERCAFEDERRHAGLVEP